jgi:hypothetical protein
MKGDHRVAYVVAVLWTHLTPDPRHVSRHRPADDGSQATAFGSQTGPFPRDTSLCRPYRVCWSVFPAPHFLATSVLSSNTRGAF